MTTNGKMHASFLIFINVAGLLLIVVSSPVLSRAQSNGETQLPAGTLVRCTLEEPNFSSRTAEVGEPVVCQLSSVTVFGRSIFPRGAYLAGHLAEDKEPGRLASRTCNLNELFE